MLLKNILLLLLLLGSLFSLQAQLELKAERQTATYSPGDTAWLVLSSSQSGIVEYAFIFDRFTSPLKTGTHNLTSGQPLRFPFVYQEPGVVHAQVKQGNSISTLSLVFDPFQISTLVNEPADFDSFWEGKKAELNSISIDPQLTEISQTTYSTTYRINLATVANRRVYGYISVPKGGGPFPAILSLPSFGDGANIVQSDPTIAEQGGAISLTISIHNAEPDAIDPNAYQPNDIDDPDSYYFRWAVQAGLRAIEYLFTRSDFDQQHLGVAGVSQGGGLAIMLAGLDDRVNLLTVSNPAYCQHAGLAFGKASGFPYLLDNSRNSVGSASHEAATLAASAYYDAVFFAKRYQGPALMVISYQDDVCPAATSLAAFNQLSGTKVLLHARDLGHVHPQEYWNGRFDFFRQHFLPMRTPPWPWPSTTTGYFADAGNDQSINASSKATLQGKIFFNAQPANNWPVQWEKKSGPGAVLFDPENNNTTDVTFGAAGNYRLQFSGRDLSMLNSSGMFYSVIDALQVEVDGNGQVDTQAPSVNLQTANTIVNGPFLVNVTFNEPVNGFAVTDIAAQNATISNLSGSDDSYLFTASPIQAGTIRLQVAAAQVQDTAGNNNLPSNELIIVYEDTTTLVTPDTEPPFAILSTDSVIVSGQFNVKINFSEPIVGFENNDLHVVNGSIGPLNGVGQNFSVPIIPQLSGEVKLVLPAAQVLDTAGNANIASDTLIIFYAEPARALLQLSAQLRGKRVLLSWITNTDFKNQQFTLQRATDSLHFAAIKIIPSENRSAGPTQYQTEDGQPLPGKSFYRLIQHEINGVEKATNIVEVDVDFDTEQLSLYPVPTSETLFVNLSEYAGKEAEIKIYDLNGRPVGEQLYDALPDETLELDVSTWENGFYCMRFTIKGSPRFSRKFSVFKNRQ